MGLVVALAPLASAAAATPATPPLDALAGTLGDLKASLSTIRQEMEAMRTAPGAGTAMPREERCAAPRAATDDATGLAVADELARLRATSAAERAAWQHAEAAMTGELVNTRERLSAAEAAAAALQSDRERLVRRITELDDMLQKAHTGDVVDGLVDRRRASIEPVEPDPGAELSAAELLRVARPALAGEARPALKPAGGRALARASNQLDLQAELALAQLRIAELNTALEAARMRHEAMAAEVTTLRSLTDGQIRQFMGRND